MRYGCGLLALLLCLSVASCQKKPEPPRVTGETQYPPQTTLRWAEPVSPLARPAPEQLPAGFVQTASSEREETVSHVMLHFMSAVGINAQKPYDWAALATIFAQSQTSAHYVIDRNGMIYALVPENRAAWHAGKGEWQGDSRYTNRMNQYAIGIELLAIGSQQDMAKYLTAQQYDALRKEDVGFTTAQYLALDRLLADILERNPGITADRQHILGHDEYTARKNDPGELFDWGRLTVIST